MAVTGITGLTYDSALAEMSNMTEEAMTQAMLEILSLGPDNVYYQRAIMTNEPFWSNICDKKYYALLSTVHKKSDVGFKVLSNMPGLCLKEIFFEEKVIQKNHESGSLDTLAALKNNAAWVKELYRRGYNQERPIMVNLNNKEVPLHQYINEKSPSVVFELAKEESAKGLSLNNKYPELQVMPVRGSSTEDEMLNDIVDTINQGDANDKNHVLKVMALFATFEHCSNYPWFELFLGKVTHCIKAYLNSVEEDQFALISYELLTSKAISKSSISVVENAVHEWETKKSNAAIIDELEFECVQSEGEVDLPAMAPY